jgi:hypothetical protein
VGGVGKEGGWMGGLVGEEKRGWDFVHVHIIRYGFPPILTFWEVEGLLRRAKKEKGRPLKKVNSAFPYSIDSFGIGTYKPTHPSIHPHGRIDEWAVLFKG